MTQKQLAFRAIINSPKGRRHEGAKQRIDEIQDRLTAAEVLGEQQRPAFPGGFLPCCSIALKDARSSLAKTVDALFNVADHETIPAGLLQRAQDLVLRGIDILVFIDENAMEAPLQIESQVGQLVVFPEQAQRVL